VRDYASSSAPNVSNLGSRRARYARPCGQTHAAPASATQSTLVLDRGDNRCRALKDTTTCYIYAGVARAPARVPDSHLSPVVARERLRILAGSEDLVHGESIEEGVRREVREETGLTVEPIMLTGVYKNMSRGVVALVFRCRALGGELSSNSEVSDFRWATSEEVRSMAAEVFAIRILDALGQDARPAVRQHDGVRLT
jgi:hypothetical protein